MEAPQVPGSQVENAPLKRADNIHANEYTLKNTVIRGVHMLSRCYTYRKKFEVPDTLNPLLRQAIHPLVYFIKN